MECQNAVQDAGGVRGEIQLEENAGLENSTVNGRRIYEAVEADLLIGESPEAMGSETGSGGEMLSWGIGWGRLTGRLLREKRQS